MAKIWHDYNEAYYKVHPTPPGSFMPPSPVNPDDLNKPESLAKGVEKPAETAAGSNQEELKAETKALDGTLPVTSPASGESAPMGTNEAPGAASGNSDSASSAGSTSASASTSASSPSPAPAPTYTPAPSPAPAPTYTPAPSPAPAPSSALSNTESGARSSEKSKLVPYNPPTIWMPINSSGKEVHQ
jgi:hypothetical protein